MNNYDIVFLSYYERNAEKNFTLLKDRGFNVLHVSGIYGLYDAVIAAAELVKTEYFYLVDADNVVLDNFMFDYNPIVFNRSTYIWLAKNNVNGLVYGNGGIKLHRTNELLRCLTENRKKEVIEFENSYLVLIKGDMPVTPDYMFINELASITEINSTPYEAWKSGFREACKLVSLSNYYSTKPNRILENTNRLEIWCQKGQEVLNGSWVIKGACEGRAFGLEYVNDIDKLLLINDYNWLRSRYNESFQ